MMEAVRQIILSTAYIPPVEYFFHLNKNTSVYIDYFENYVKQTYRNRCYILAANGRLCLSVPILKTFGNHTKVKDIKIDYSQSWQKSHWRSIESAYNSSSFFLYYRDALEPFYNKKFKFLTDQNTALLHTLIKLCGISCEIKFTEKYIENNELLIDFRNGINPKNSVKSNFSFVEYSQVFSGKHGFMPNLSIIDLLFNEGKHCREYLNNNNINP